MEFITNKFKNSSSSCSGAELERSPDSETSSQILESTAQSPLYKKLFKSQEVFSQNQQNQVHREMLRKVDKLPPLRPFKVTFQEWMYEEMSQETRNYFLSKKAEIDDIISCRKLSEFETDEQQIQAIQEHSEKSFNLRHKSSTDMPNHATLKGQVLRISLKPDKKENIFLTARNFHKETDEFLFK